MKQTSKTHQSHTDITKRLKRAHGHLAKVVSMIEDEKPCVDIAQQLYAVERAIVQAKRTLIHDHIDHCFIAPEMGGDAQAELRALTKVL